MATEQQEQWNNNATASEQEEDLINLGDLIQIVWAKKVWFIISIVACLSLTVLYLLWAPKVYTRQATVLIKDDRQGGGGGGLGDGAFADLNLFGMSRNVDNEVLVFKANRLMRIVAERLSLDVDYTMKSGLRTVTLYTQSPVKVEFPDAEQTQALALKVTPINVDQVHLSDFRMWDPEGEEIAFEDEQTVALRDTVETPIGRLVVSPTLYYTDEYYDEVIRVNKSDLLKVARDYQQNLNSALASKLSTMINLSLQDYSITRAEDVINTLIDVYNEDVINDKNQIAINTSEFINERLVIIEQELGNVDASIETFKRENQLTDIKSEAGMYLESTSTYQREGLSLENQLTLAQYIKDYLQDPSKSKDLIPANTGISDTGVESQIADYNETLLKRDKYIANSSEKNPVVMDLNNTLTAMRQTIIRALDNIIVGLRIKIGNVRAQESQLTKRIAAVPSQQKHVLTIERQQKIKEELYLYLLNKREESALTQAITESNARIIDPATGDDKPVSPKSLIVLIAGFILGCAFPAGIIWLKMTSDTKVRTRKEVEEKLTIPFLGEVPQRKRSRKLSPREDDSQNAVVVHDGGRDSVSEAFRILRTNISFMQVDNSNLKTIMFTSSNAGAGKTFVSTNFSVSLAMMGKKVVLIDLDIRKGTLSGLLQGVDVNNGMSNYLSGVITSIDSLIKPSGWHENLDVIPAGPVPPNPTELLLSKRLDTLVDQLRDRYDYIILDNVPALVVADAAIVNRLADMTIYVMRAGIFDKRQLPDLERLYKQKKFNNMCVVLNGIDLAGIGYGYGYGYGDEQDHKRKKSRFKK